MPSLPSRDSSLWSTAVWLLSLLIYLWARRRFRFYAQHSMFCVLLHFDTSLRSCAKRDFERPCALFEDFYRINGWCIERPSTAQKWLYWGVELVISKGKPPPRPVDKRDMTSSLPPNFSDVRLYTNKRNCFIRKTHTYVHFNCLTQILVGYKSGSITDYHGFN